jgi:hypothetical protein
MTNREIERHYTHLNENQKATLRNLRNRRRKGKVTELELSLINTLQRLGREGTPVVENTVTEESKQTI